MTMRASLRNGLLTLFIGGLLGGSVLVSQAAVGESPSPNLSRRDIARLIESNIRRDCQGPHCSFSALWTLERDSRRAFQNLENHVLAASLSMDTLLRGSSVTVDQADNGTAAISVPIDGNGEIVGYAVSFYDSPPILFRPGGMVQAVTEGLGFCSMSEKQRANIFSCDPDQMVGKSTVGGGEDDKGDETIQTAFPDVWGRWTDTWQAYSDPDGDGTFSTQTNSVQCMSNIAGSVGTCIATPLTVPVRLELTRTVDNFWWGDPPQCEAEAVSKQAECDRNLAKEQEKCEEVEVEESEGRQVCQAEYERKLAECDTKDIGIPGKQQECREKAQQSLQSCEEALPDAGQCHVKAITKHQDCQAEVIAKTQKCIENFFRNLEEDNLLRRLLKLRRLGGGLSFKQLKLTPFPGAMVTSAFVTDGGPVPSPAPTPIFTPAPSSTISPSGIGPIREVD